MFSQLPWKLAAILQIYSPEYFFYYILIGLLQSITHYLNQWWKSLMAQLRTMWPRWVKGKYIFPKVVKQDSYWITDTSKYDKNIDMYIVLV